MSADCFNCDEDLSDCTCGATKTFELDYGPRCPYCGHSNSASDSDGLLYDESTEEYDCGECGRTFRVNLSISYAWSAYRVADSLVSEALTND